LLKKLGVPSEIEKLHSSLIVTIHKDISDPIFLHKFNWSS